MVLLNLGASVGAGFTSLGRVVMYDALAVFVVFNDLFVFMASKNESTSCAVDVAAREDISGSRIVDENESLEADDCWFRTDFRVLVDISSL